MNLSAQGKASFFKFSGFCLKKLILKEGIQIKISIPNQFSVDVEWICFSKMQRILWDVHRFTKP